MSDDNTWAADWDALYVSIVRPLPPEEAANSIALADFHSFADQESAETWVNQSDTHDTSWFSTGKIDGWTFLWEANGWRGATPENANRLAGSGQLYSMFWSVNSVMTFLAVEDGTVTRQFDPLFHDDVPPPTAEVGARLAAEGRAGLGRLPAPVRAFAADVVDRRYGASSAVLVDGTGRSILGSPLLISG